MELHIKDRIYIPQILPQKNDFMGYHHKREIVKKISLTEKDIEDYEINNDKENNRVTWNIEKDQNVPLIVDFSKEELQYLKESCEKLSETEYPDDFWAVVEKIYNEAN